MSNITITDSGVSKSLHELIETCSPQAMSATLYESANIVRDQAKLNLKYATPKWNRPAVWTRPNFRQVSSQPLISGIRVSKPNLRNNSIRVHAMDSKSYPLRFFEGGTVDRYQVNYGRVRLNPPRWLSKYKKMKLNFFSRALKETTNQVFDNMASRLKRQIHRIDNKK